MAFAPPETGYVDPATGMIYNSFEEYQAAMYGVGGGGKPPPGPSGPPPPTGSGYINLPANQSGGPMNEADAFRYGAPTQEQFGSNKRDLYGAGPGWEIDGGGGPGNLNTGWGHIPGPEADPMQDAMDLLKPKQHQITKDLGGGSYAGPSRFAYTRPEDIEASGAMVQMLQGKDINEIELGRQREADDVLKRLREGTVDANGQRTKLSPGEEPSTEDKLTLAAAGIDWRNIVSGRSGYGGSGYVDPSKMQGANTDERKQLQAELEYLGGRLQMAQHNGVEPDPRDVAAFNYIMQQLYPNSEPPPPEQKPDPNEELGRKNNPNPGLYAPFQPPIDLGPSYGTHGR